PPVDRLRSSVDRHVNRPEKPDLHVDRHHLRLREYGPRYPRPAHQRIDQSNTRLSPGPGVRRAALPPRGRRRGRPARLASWRASGGGARSTGGSMPTVKLSREAVGGIDGADLLGEVREAVAAAPVDGEWLEQLCEELDGRIARADLMLGILPIEAPEMRAE